jgi:peptide/nickel transport system substrate-binding protein
MNTKPFSSYLPTFAIMLLLLLGACQSPPAPEPIIETLVVRETVQAPPEQVIKVVTPTSEPDGPRTLTICSDWAPDTLFIHGTLTNAAGKIWSMIYDGPIDENSFGYQPVILEKLPNLADGDAIITPVVVGKGDTVVDAGGVMVTLDPAAEQPLMLVPAGGGEAVAYQGGEFEMDQLSATFQLLPNLTWSDGTPLTAADSVYNFNLLDDPNFGGLDWWLHTSAYEALDERTLVWTGLPGFMDATYYLNFFSPLPEHVLSKYSPAELYTAEEAALTPLGWGPYRIEEHILGEQITLQKNPHYFRAKEGLPKFETLIIKYIPESSGALISALLSGECDLATPGNIELMLKLEEAGLVSTIISETPFFEQITVVIQPDSYDDGYQMGSDRPDFFSDVRTRQAIALCLDRQAAADLATFGRSEVLDTYIPHTHPLFNNQVPHYDYDPQAGIALLEQIGWMDHDDNPDTARVALGVHNIADGTPLEFSYRTTDARQNYSALLEQSMADCGIHAKLMVFPISSFFQGGPVGGNFYRDGELKQFAWWTGAQPPCDLYFASEVPGPVGESWVSIVDGKEREFITTSGPNINGFADQVYDAACRKALNKLPGQVGYLEAHHEAQRLFSELLPSIPLFSPIQFVATRPDMCNVILDPTGGDMWNIEEFDYGEGCVE